MASVTHADAWAWNDVVVMLGSHTARFSWRFSGRLVGDSKDPMDTLAAHRLCGLFSRFPTAGVVNFYLCRIAIYRSGSARVFVAVALAFFLNTSSYYGEILRAGIESIGSGQMEAARSTGLSKLQAMSYVIVPQAIRNVLPDLLSNTLEVVKLTSIASVVALPELLYAADMARSVTYNASPVVLAALMYLILLWPLVRLLSRLEHKMLASH